MILEALFQTVGTVISSAILAGIAHWAGIDSPWLLLPIAGLPVYGMSFRMLEYKHLMESTVSTADRLARENKEQQRTIQMLNNAINNK